MPWFCKDVRCSSFHALSVLQFFQRIFSLDTFLRPLPPGIAQSIARSIGFFTRIFTQFWGEISCLVPPGSFCVTAPRCISSAASKFGLVLAAAPEDVF